ncbi:MAG: SH3 domain-containing protein [Lachnospiraceae bacterium]|nr:SH3 domain-containing protein [Lachnospiraceae bacterium]
MKKNKRNGIKHILAALLFCMVLSVGMVSLADEKGTVIAKSAVIRAAADPQSEKLASVPSGKVIDIISKTSGTDGNYWYQVYVDSNTKGYIRSDLIKVADGVNIPTTQGGAASGSQPADTSSTAVTPVDARQVSVISNNTNIRESASTTSASRAKANRGMILTVTGEANGTDGKKWYQVTFTYNNSEVTGFIRSDLVTTDNVPADTATSQIVGEENPGEEQPPETVPSEEQPPEQPAETNQQQNDTVIPMDVDEVPYIMPGFEPIALGSNGQEYKGYKNGSFFIFYAQKPDGEEGWYLFDSERGVYQRYVYTSDGVVPPEQGIVPDGLIPVIVMMVIIVILLAVVGLLLLKLKGQGNSYKKYRGYDDDDDDDQEDDDIEDLEDLEDDEEEEPQPIRRPQAPQPPRRPTGPQPVRRPQAGAGPQAPRRPQAGAGPQAPRRPQGNPANGNVPQGPQPPKRPQGTNPSNNSNGARPQGPQAPRRPQGGAGPQPARRPQVQNERVPNEKGPAQKGYKAKNLLEDDDMDIMDIE